MDEWLKPGPLLTAVSLVFGLAGGALGWLWKGFQLQRTAEEALRQAVAANKRGDELEEKVSRMDREIGEAKASAAAAVEAERHRIDIHAARSAEQQRQNAEFFAGEAKAALARVEVLLQRQGSKSA